MNINATVHLYHSDEIAPRNAQGFRWLAVGDMSIFARDADFIRLRDAIDALLIASPQGAEGGS